MYWNYLEKAIIIRARIFQPSWNSSVQRECFYSWVGWWCQQVASLIETEIWSSGGQQMLSRSSRPGLSALSSSTATTVSTQSGLTWVFQWMFVPKRHFQIAFSIWIRTCVIACVTTCICICSSSWNWMMGSSGRIGWNDAGGGSGAEKYYNRSRAYQKCTRRRQFLAPLWTLDAFSDAKFRQKRLRLLYEDDNLSLVVCLFFFSWMANKLKEKILLTMVVWSRRSEWVGLAILPVRDLS